jgi:D-ribose pyranose/furanose isomerase RbsD
MNSLIKSRFSKHYFELKVYILILNYYSRIVRLNELKLTDPDNINLELIEERFPYGLRFRLTAEYKKCELIRNGECKPYTNVFYILSNRQGYFELRADSTHLRIKSEIEIGQVSGYPPRITIFSKPLSRKEIDEIDKTFAPNDLKIYWSVYAYGFLDDDSMKNNLIIISIDGSHKITRKEFCENILQKADMLKREFIEVIIEEIGDLNVSDHRLKATLQLLLDKQKFLSTAMEKLKNANKDSEYIEIIGEVRKVVEGIKEDNNFRELYKEIYKRRISSSSEEVRTNEAIGIVGTLIGKSGIIDNIFTYTSKLGVHVTTKENKQPYRPEPNRIDAEFAVQQALITLNYLIKLLKEYIVHFT